MGMMGQHVRRGYVGVEDCEGMIHEGRLSALRLLYVPCVALFF